MHNARQRLCHRGFLKRDTPAHLKALRLRAHRILRKSAVYVHPQGEQALAFLLLSHPAGHTLAAVQIRVYRYMVPRLHARHLGSCLRDNAGELMSQYNRRRHVSRTLFPVIDMDVRAANTAGLIIHQDFFGTQGAKCHLPHLKLRILPCPYKETSFHRFSLLFYFINVFCKISL